MNDSVVVAILQGQHHLPYTSARVVLAVVVPLDEHVEKLPAADQLEHKLVRNVVAVMRY